MRYTLTVIDHDRKVMTVEAEADNDEEAIRIGERYGTVIIIAEYDEIDDTE